MFGCMYAGAVPVPVQPAGKGIPPRLHGIIQDCRPCAVLAGADPASDPTWEPPAPIRTLTLREVLAGGEEAWHEPRLASDALAFLQYTSGSTGDPKGVMVSHRNVLANLESIARAFGTDERSHVVSWLPPFHDMGLVGALLQPLYAGCPLTFMTPDAFLQNPIRWLWAISRFGGTISGGPDFAYDYCARRIPEGNQRNLDLSSWTIAFNGAEPVRGETMERFAEAFRESGFRRESFFPCYGLAEATLFVSGGDGKGRAQGPSLLGIDRNLLGDHMIQPASPVSPGTLPVVDCGACAEGMDVRIVDPESGQECPPDRLGEIWVKGENVALGYWGRPGESEACFAASLPGAGEGFLRTGDLGFLRAGRLYPVGRMKDLIILRGRNLHPQDLERTSSEACRTLLPCVAAAFSQLCPSGESLVLLQEIPAKDAANAAGILRDIRKALARGHGVEPAEIALVRRGSLPRTPSGKIRRSECRRAFEEGTLAPLARWEQGGVSDQVPMAVGQAMGVSAPSGEAGRLQILCRAVAALAGLPPAEVDPGRSFVEQGLDSLKASELSCMLLQHHGIDLPPSEILAAESLEVLGQKAVAVALPPPQAPEAATVPAIVHPSLGQERLWFLQQLDPGSPVHNLGGILWMDGPLDPRALDEAWMRIAERHGALRTAIRTRSGKPYLDTVDHLVPFMEFQDLSALPPLDAESACRQQAHAMVRDPFDLAKAPLLRVRLLRLGPGRHAMVVIFHHMISDGQSAGILAGELLALYQEATAGVPSGLPPLPFPHWEHASRERAVLESGGLEGAILHWVQRLGREDGDLRLPATRPHLPSPTGRGARIPLRVPIQTHRELRTLASRERATLHATLLAGYASLLLRYVSLRIVTIGVPFACRNHPVTTGQVGFMVNILPLPIDVSGRPSFRELIRRTRDELVAALPHAQAPLDRVVTDLARLGHRVPGNPIKAAFVLQEGPFRNRHLPGLSLRWDELDNGMARFDLTLQIDEQDGELAGFLEYSQDLFDSWFIKGMAEDLVGLLEFACRAPDRPLALIPLPSTQRGIPLIPVATAGEGIASPGLLQLIKQQVIERSEAPAVTSGPVTWSYGDLERHSDRIAQDLLARRAKAGDKVVIWAHRSPSWVASMLGALKAGCTYIPMDPDQPLERLGHVMEESGAAVILAGPNDIGNLGGFSEKALCLHEEDALPPGLPCALAPRPRSSQDQAYVIYTSGSTGLPKGAMIPFRGLENLVQWHLDTYQIQPGERVSQIASPGFDAAQWEIWPALSAGANLHLVDEEARLAPEALRNWLARSGIHIAFVPTPMAEELLRKPWPSNLLLRAMLTGGDRLAVRPPEGLGFKVINHYGPTECSVVATAQEVAPQDGTQPSLPPAIGGPIRNLRVHLVDANLQPVPPGVPGELLLGGEGLATGYLANPSLTAERFIPDPFSGQPGSRLYRTGDLAWREPGGTIHFLGRTDHQIKLRGHRIEPGEIEHQIRQHPDVRDALVLCLGSEAAEKRLVAYVLASPGTAAALTAYLKGRLPGYMVPSAILSLDQFPLTRSGKVDRSALPAPSLSPRKPERPGTEREEWLLKIWRQVLGREDVGIHEDFFDWGGNSLKAAELATRLREELGLPVTVRMIFTHPTVADLAGALQEGIGGEKPIPACPAGAEFPLSHAQRRLWILDQFKEHSPAYNIPAALLLTGPLDQEAFEQAWDILGRRHECFRTGFQSLGGKPRQILHPWEGFPFTRLDFRHDRAPLARAEETALREAETPFDLSTPPLARGTLIRLDDERTLFLWTMHHIIGDAWSMGILLRELAGTYSALRKGEAPSLPPLRIQYKDYSHWQNERLLAGFLKEDRDFWISRLQGSKWDLELPLDKPRPPIQSFNGNRETFELDSRETERLKAVGQRCQASLFMVFLATWSILLHRYTGQRCFGIGTPVAGRDHSDLFSMVGFLANTLVIPVLVTPERPFLTFLEAIRDTALDAFDHRAYPFDLLVEDLDLARDLSRPPLFNVMLAFNNAGLDPEQVSMEGVRLAPFRQVQFNMSKFDLILFVDETSHGLECRLEYSTDLFEPGTMRRWAGNLRTLLQSIAAAPGMEVRDLDAIHPKERERLIQGFNRTESPFPSLGVQSLFEAQVAAGPDRPAVMGKEGSLTYEELNRRANQLAHRLRQQFGGGPGMRVGLILDRSLDMLVTVIGVLKSGSAYVAMDPTYPAERIREMLKDSSPPLVVTDRQRPEFLAGFPGRILALDAEGEATRAFPSWDPPCLNAPDDPLYVLYTSGSTGSPNGVMLSHGQLANLVHWHLNQSGIDGSLCCLQFTSLNFCVSFQEIFSTLCAGGRLSLIGEMERRDLDHLLRHLEEENVANLYLPFTFLNLLFNETRRWEKAPAIGLRNIITAGEQLQISAGLRDFLSTHPDVRLHNHYGSSEVHVITAHTVPAIGPSDATPPVGRPIANTRIFILDDELRLAPQGAMGQIHVACASPWLGYLGKEDLTRGRLVTLPWQPGAPLVAMGDMGRWTPDGELMHLGRRDSQIKIRGFRVEPGEVEHALLQTPGVQACVVVPSKVSGGQMALVAYVVLAREATSGAVQQVLKQKLPGYMIPMLIPLSSLPLLPSGKVDREALPDPQAGGGMPGRTHLAPQSPLEMQLARIWEDILGQQPIGIQDDFFEIGGHSLKATQVVTRIHDAMGLSLSLREFFQESTIERLAILLSARTREDSFDELEALLHEVASLPDEKVRELLGSEGRTMGQGA